MEKSQKSDKMQALESALRKIEKDFGKGSIMKLGEVAARMNVKSYQREHYLLILLLVLVVCRVGES